MASHLDLMLANDLQGAKGVAKELELTLTEAAALATGLEPVHARILSNTAKTATYEAGEVIVRRGAYLNHWFHIASGLVLGAVPLESGEVHPAFFHGQGYWLGDAALIARRPLYCDYVAVERSTVLKVDARQYLKLLQLQPSFAIARAQRMASDLHATSDALAMYKVGDPFFRCVYLLSLMCESRFMESARHAALPARGRMDIVAPQDLLARLSGLSRSRYSEYLHELRHCGLLDVSYRRLQVLHAGAWCRWLSRLRRQRIVPATTLSAPRFAEEIAALARDDVTPAANEPMNDPA